MNIIKGNGKGGPVTIAGGGIYAPRGRIENNTIYGNTCTNGIAGVYLEAGLPANALVFQNNIVWGNHWDDGPSTNDQFSSAMVGAMEYCALDVLSSVNRGSTTNEVNAGGTTDTSFESTNIAEGYHEYLHLSSDSLCIDKGQPEVEDEFDNPLYEAGQYFEGNPQADPPTCDKLFTRVPDDQISFVDEDIARDIGADEYPTNLDGFFYWWQSASELEP